MLTTKAALQRRARPLKAPSEDRMAFPIPLPPVVPIAGMFNDDSDAYIVSSDDS